MSDFRDSRYRSSLQKKLSSHREFDENRHSDNRTLLKGAKQIIYTRHWHASRPILWKIWQKKSTCNAVERLWISRKAAHWMPYFSERRSWNYILIVYRAAVYDILKSEKVMANSMYYVTE